MTGMKKRGHDLLSLNFTVPENFSPPGGVSERVTVTISEDAKTYP
jgi:hypothetical protein